MGKSPSGFIFHLFIICHVTAKEMMSRHWLKLKTDLYSAIKSEDAASLDSGTSQLGSHSGFDVSVPIRDLCHEPG